MAVELSSKRIVWNLAASVCLFATLFVKSASAEDGSALEVRELRIALKAAQEDADQLRRNLGESEEQRKTLVISLSEAVRAAEEQVVATQATELKLQALGVDLVTREDNALEQRLLKAVRDLDIAQQELDRKNGALRSLSEAYLKTLNTSEKIAPAVRSEAERALAVASSALQAKVEGDHGVVNVDSARVVSLDAEIGLLVLDAGRRTGVRVGTPIQVLRGDRTIYTALIVDVRDAISGAVLQDRLASDEVQVGDRVRLLPDKQQL